MPEKDPDALGPDVRELIATRIETPTHLDVLMVLYRAPRPALTLTELAAATHSEARVVTRAAADLERGRILGREGERYRYAPAQPALAAAVDNLAHAYDHTPVQLIRAVYNRAPSMAKLLADAFRLHRPE